MRIPLACVVLAIMRASAAAEDWDPPPEERLSLLPGTLELETTYAVASDGAQLAMARLRVRHDLRHNYYVGDVSYGLDGGVGWVSGGRTAYTVAARIGTEMAWAAGVLLGGCADGCRAHRTGITTGVMVDAAGDRIPRAWTIPLDAHWHYPTTRETYLGPVAGVSWAFAGADRGLGLRGGVELIVRAVFDHHGRFGPRDIHIAAGVERIAGATFVGLAVGLATADRHDRLRTIPL
jgi:hypothetical protein